MTPRHPAKYNDPVLVEMAYWLPRGSLVLDPFAGVGRLAEIKTITAVCIEVERDWATQVVGNATALPFRDDTFDAIATSPCYGNRMADHHDAKDNSVRHTYKHYIGHDLHADNAGQMQWGGAYRQLHRRAWVEAVRVLKPGGTFLLNSSDHIRKKQVQHVTDFHLEILMTLGLDLQRTVLIKTDRLRHGQNHDVRVSHETVSILTKGSV
jgi:tRNA G10  N-methylase Trm11